MPIIPNKIHAIWLGNPPPDDVLENLVNWKTTNPGYEVNLWIDSSTYSDDRQEQHKQIIDWAEKNNIIINDIALSPDKSHGNVLGRSDLYENMLSRQYYDDELNGAYRNLAAASDILRLEILYHHGGIYIDAGDIFPDEPLSESLDAHYGFYFHWQDNGQLNNDILGSIPGGMLVEMYRNAVHENFRLIYSDEIKIAAHRNQAFTSPHIDQGRNPRHMSTLVTSGPGALTYMLEMALQAGTKIRDANDDAITDETRELLAFDSNARRVPAHGTNLSWSNQENSYNQLVPILRNYIRAYFFEEIFRAQKKVAKTLAQNQSVPPSLSPAQIQKHRELNELLISLMKKLQSLPVTFSLHDVNHALLSRLKPEDIAYVNKAGNNILERMDKCAHLFDAMIVYCENNIKPDVMSETIQKLSRKDHTPSWKDFIADVLDHGEDYPDLDRMKQIIRMVNYTQLR